MQSAWPPLAANKEWGHSFIIFRVHRASSIQHCKQRFLVATLCSAVCKLCARKKVDRAGIGAHAAATTARSLCDAFLQQPSKGVSPELWSTPQNCGSILAAELMSAACVQVLPVTSSLLPCHAAQWASDPAFRFCVDHRRHVAATTLRSLCGPNTTARISGVYPQTVGGNPLRSLHLGMSVTSPDRLVQQRDG